MTSTLALALLLSAAPPAAPSSSEQAAPIVPVPKPTPAAPAMPAVPLEPPHRVSPVDLRAVSAATRSATLGPSRSTFVNAVQVYPFAEGAVYRAFTAPGRVTDVVLQPGEVLGAVASGDTARWVVGDTSSGTGDAKRTHVLVKPFAAGLATNLIVTTDRRTYHIALSSAASTAMTALSWTYPQDDLLAIKRAAETARAAAPVATGIDVTKLQFGYAITGDSPPWRPLRTFDDGRQTYIEFPASLAVGEAPPLFLVGSNGEAQLVNYRVQGRFYVVDRLFDAAELRLGLKRQAIVRISRSSSPANARRG